MSYESLGELIQWLGHDAVRIDAAKHIYFDPFEIRSGPEADLILITHEHYDHCSPRDVEKIQGRSTVIVTEKDSAKKLSGNIQVMAPGDSITVKGIKIRAVPAYNIDKTFHPKNRNWLGFIIEIDGVSVYHAGDTDFIDEMKTIETDIALLPVSGTYVMTADEAAQAALAINPSLAVPIHYGSLVGSNADADRFKNVLKNKIDVRILDKN